MKKRILAVLCAAAVMLSLTACSDNASTSGGSSVQDSTSSVAESASSDNADDSSTESTESTESSESEESQGGEYVKYVLDGEITPTMISDSRLNEGNKVRLANVIKKLEAGEAVTVAYIGGSITQGTSAGGELCYARLTTDWLEETYPNAKITYVNAGIGATGSYIGVHRVGTDVLSQNPDLVFVEFSVNDTTEHIERNMESYDSLLRTIWKYETNPAIVTIATTQEDGTSFQDYHLQVVQKYDLPMISYRNAILNVIKNGDIVWSDISDDNIHPNVPGHKIVSQLLQSYISDVAADLDSISGEESDFSEPATAAKYEDGKLIGIEAEGAQATGFTAKDAGFGGFNGFWLARTSAATGTFDGAELTFTVDAKSIGILYGKVTGHGAIAEVYVDGELVKTLNADFTGGWGNYVECEDIISFDESGTHTVKIVPIDPADNSGGIFYVSRFAIA